MALPTNQIANGKFIFLLNWKCVGRKDLALLTLLAETMPKP
jgi:hypothetical protein